MQAGPDMRARSRVATMTVSIVALVIGANVALGAGSGDPAAVKNDDGKYSDKDGAPTYKVGADGTVDWYTYSGYRRYHSDCHVCHGPDGEGSSYGPALKNSLQNESYAEFLGVVASGRKNVTTSQNNVMP